MEAMRLRVRSVRVLADERLAVARVSAVSKRKMRGRVAARIDLEVLVEIASGERESTIRARARDEALGFLDLA
jgi:hypothetical protein